MALLNQACSFAVKDPRIQKAVFRPEPTLEALVRHDCSKMASMSSDHARKADGWFAKTSGHIVLKFDLDDEVLYPMEVPAVRQYENVVLREAGYWEPDIETTVNVIQGNQNLRTLRVQFVKEFEPMVLDESLFQAIPTAPRLELVELANMNVPSGLGVASRLLTPLHCCKNLNFLDLRGSNINDYHCCAIESLLRDTRNLKALGLAKTLLSDDTAAHIVMKLAEMAEAVNLFCDGVELQRQFSAGLAQAFAPDSSTRNLGLARIIKGERAATMHKKKTKEFRIMLDSGVASNAFSTFYSDRFSLPKIDITSTAINSGIEHRQYIHFFQQTDESKVSLPTSSYAFDLPGFWRGDDFGFWEASRSRLFPRIYKHGKTYVSHTH